MCSKLKEDTEIESELIFYRNIDLQQEPQAISTSSPLLQEIVGFQALYLHGICSGTAGMTNMLQGKSPTPLCCDSSSKVVSFPLTMLWVLHGPLLPASLHFLWFNLFPVNYLLVPSFLWHSIPLSTLSTVSARPSFFHKYSWPPLTQMACTSWYCRLWDFKRL